MFGAGTFPRGATATRAQSTHVGARSDVRYRAHVAATDRAAATCESGRVPGTGAPFKDRRFDAVAVVALVVFFVAMLNGVVIIAVPALVIVFSIIVFAPRRTNRRRR